MYIGTGKRWLSLVILSWLLGHYHFFSAYESDGKRLILQAPSLDSGSEWFDNTNGGRNSAGVLTLVIGGSEKWSNIRVIR